ncbi:MAG: fibronectin type III domain-containing protein [Deltaproteobacteria bacterium]|nr:fibronectin type III domain-containing protein [Deltaproteobacteria bacterium]
MFTFNPILPKQICWEAGTQKRRKDMKKLLRMFCAVGLVTLLAVSMTGCGDGDDDNGTSPPAAPTGVSAVFNNASSATVSWSPVAGATSYNVYYADASGVTKSAYDVKVNTTGTSYTFEDAEKLAVDTTYYFVVTAVKDSTESAESIEVSAEYTTFAQGDLTGTWNFTLFYTGIGAPANYLGWLRMNITLDADGVATVNYYKQSDGGVTPPDGSLILTIDGKGLVTQSGDYTGNTSHNVMSSNKELIIGTDTIAGFVPETEVQVIRIMQKAPDWGTMEESFSANDLTNIPFVFHQLASGAEQNWVRGIGATNDSGQVTITSITDSVDPTVPGELPDANYDTLSINPSTGVVSSTFDTSFKGVMTLDKKMIIGTTKDMMGTFQLRVILVSGQTFTMGDLAGVYKFASIFDGDSALWQYGTVAINSSGVTDFLEYLDSTGDATLPPSATLSMNASGTITNAADSTFLGNLSFNKELMVSTFTAGDVDSELYGLSLAVK